MQHRFIDIGLNLASRDFSRDWQKVLARARDAGVGQAILTGTSLESSATCQTFTEQEPGLYFTAGVHPHAAKTLGPRGIEVLRGLLRDPKAVAVGETGLDYFRDLSPRSVQKDSFRRHIDLACELGKPMFLHERGAHEDFLAILDEYRSILPRCVVHCFTGTADQAREYAKRDLYFGITGWVDQARRNADLLGALPFIPMNRLMLETDAPYLSPDSYRTKERGRNEPDSMPLIARAVADARGIGLDHVVSAAYNNTARFFGLA